MNSHQLTNPDDIKNFVMGGKAYFTLVSAATGTRFTYRSFVARDTPTRFFVGAMVGSDNNTAYSYLGVLEDAATGINVRLTAKSKFDASETRVKALEYFIRNINSKVLPTNLEFWHEGRCGCCGRRLTVPASIESGIGPECARKRAVDKQPMLV